MKGLVLKDLLVLRKTAMLYLVIELILLTASLFNPAMQMFAILYFIILAMMLPVTALAYDERAGWENMRLLCRLRGKSWSQENICSALSCLASRLY